jgi:hypothetical protein
VDHNPIQLMMLDVSRELVDKAKVAKAEATRSRSDYDKGRHYALYEVISLLAQQADAFGIDRKSVGLEDVDPERDLLGTDA